MSPHRNEQRVSYIRAQVLNAIALICVITAGMWLISLTSVTGAPTLPAPSTQGVSVNSTNSVVVNPTNFWPANQQFVRAYYTNVIDAPAAGGDLLATNNLSDVSDVAAARTNLGAHDATNLTAGLIPPERYATNSIPAWSLAATNTPSTGQIPKYDAAGKIYWDSAGATGVTSVNLTAPSAGITVSGGPITSSGSITLALADDLAALEALSGTGYAKRTGTSTWTVGSISLTADVSGILPIANGGTGVSLASTGGTGQVLQQSSTGANITVGTLSFASLSSKPTTLSGYGITDGQPLDAGLTSISGLTTSANKIIYTTGSDTYAVTDYTASARALDALTIAKGTIYVGTGSGTATALAVGSDNQVLTADSAQSSGVKWATPAGSSVNPGIADVRLSADSSNAVALADVTSTSLVYLYPFNGNQISLYVSGAWQTHTLNSSISLSLLSGYSTDTNYDVFCYSNSGTPTLESQAWTNATTRASGLQQTNGVWHKNSDATRRYVGTIRTISSTGTCDKASQRLVWSMYNRLGAKLKAFETTDTWTQTTTATWREANAGTNGLGFTNAQYLIGLAEDEVNIRIHAFGSNSANTYMAVGIGIDSNTTNSADTSGGYLFGASSQGTLTTGAEYVGLPSGVGLHTVYWMEISSGGTTTWRGDYDKGSDDTPPAYIQCGLIGRIRR